MNSLLIACRYDKSRTNKGGVKYDWKKYKLPEQLREIVF